MTNNSFGSVDLAVFIGMLATSVAVGIYYAVKDRKLKNVENYYFGGRQMSPIPVGLSISVTYISAITVIGFPSESYLYGMVVIWFSWFTILPYIIACLYYIPLIHRLNLTSIYQYLEYRFDKKLRQAASVIAIVNLVFYMGMTIYIPGLALSAVTPLNLTWTIALTSVICTFYTTLGGMKAVVWTDTIQTLAMVAGALAALIKTVMIVGGFEKIWPALERGGRLNILNFNLDPTIRYTFWSFLLGKGIGSCRMTCSSQAISQRYLSCKNAAQARIAAMVSVIPTCLLMGTAVFTGAAMYTYYEGCDPLKSGKIKKPDQMVPYLVVEIFADIPGMAGLFLAAGFSGTLSSVSSGINSVSALILQDFIVPNKPKMSEMTRITISKFMVFGFGVLVMCVAYVESNLNATIVRMLFTIGSTLEGPLLGVFTLGMLLPWTNTKGAAFGQIVGTAFTAWLSFGSLFYGDHGNQRLPVSTDKCPVSNTTHLLENATHFSETNFSAPFATTFLPSTETYLDTTTAEWEPMDLENGNFWNETASSYPAWDANGTTSFPSDASDQAGPTINSTLYALSYLYLSVISVVVTVFVGLLVSFLTGANSPQKADPKLFVPMFDNDCLPEGVRKFFRFGVPPLQKDTDEKKPIESDDEECSLGHVREGYKPMLEAKESVL